MEPLNDMIIYIDMVKTINVGPEWSKKHFPYPHHRIIYVYGGEAILILNDSRHKLEPNCIYLIPAFTIVETLCNDHIDLHYIHFRLQSSCALDILSMYKPEFKIEALRDSVDLFYTIKQHYRNDSPYSVMMTKSVINKILAPFFKTCNKPSSKFYRFESVLSYIDTNLNTKMSNESLSKIMGIDSVYFSNLFSQTFSLSPNQYIINKRLEKAQLLLVSTDHKIYEIARKTGFENNMYFSRLFKKKIGITATEYRIRNKLTD